MALIALHCSTRVCRYGWGQVLCLCTWYSHGLGGLGRQFEHGNVHCASLADKCVSNLPTGHEDSFLAYSVLIFAYAFSRALFGEGMGINLDLFGLSIVLWVISETLHRFWSPTLRWVSGFIGLRSRSRFWNPHPSIC